MKFSTDGIPPNGLILRGKLRTVLSHMENSGQTSSPVTGQADFQRIVDPLKPAFAELEKYLFAEVESFEPEVRPLVEYCFGHSGKKLRPILVFSMGLNPGEALDPAIIRAAAIVELVHLATLVHDDILDEADMRHRTETLVSKYGPHVAVLLGDALFAHALHLAAQYPGVEVCRSVSLATRQVCSGEIAQTFARGADIPDTAAYYRMIDLKTAELFTVSAYLGGFLSGFDESQLEAARAFARHLGIAYQIYDDAADIFAEESVAGKTLGTDLATGKFTLPILLWLDSQGKENRDDLVARLKSADNGGIDVRAELTKADMLTRTGEAFYREIQSSRDAIQAIPGQERQAHLSLLADFVEQAWNKFNIR